MEPISLSISLELGSLLLAAVGALATWVHHRHAKAARRQRERHFQHLRRSSYR